jgi:alpha-methylacyl-CoA racemase
MNTALWESTAKQFEAAFKTKTRSEWEQVFDGSDACVAPVLTPDEVWAHPQVQARCQSVQDRSVPPAPALSRSPLNRGEVDESNQTHAVLHELGFMDEEIAAAMPKNSAGMEMVQAWPQKV